MNTTLFTSLTTQLPLTRVSLQSRTAGNVARVVMTQVFAGQHSAQDPDPDSEDRRDLGVSWDPNVLRAVESAVGDRSWKTGLVYVIPLDCFPRTQEMVIEVDGVEYGTEVLQVEVEASDDYDHVHAHDSDRVADGDEDEDSGDVCAHGLGHENESLQRLARRRRLGVVPSREYDGGNTGVDVRSVMANEMEMKTSKMHPGGGAAGLGAFAGVGVGVDDNRNENGVISGLDMATLALYKSFAEYASEWQGRWGGWGGKSRRLPRVVEIATTCIPWRNVQMRQPGVPAMPVVVKTLFLQELGRCGSAMIHHIPLSAMGRLVPSAGAGADAGSNASGSRSGIGFSILPLDVGIDVRSESLRMSALDIDMDMGAGACAHPQVHPQPVPEVRCFTHDVLTWSFKESGKQLIQLALEDKNESEVEVAVDGKEGAGMDPARRLEKMVAQSYELATTAMESDFVVVIPLTEALQREYYGGPGHSQRGIFSTKDLFTALIFVSAIVYFVWLAKKGGWGDPAM